VILLPAIDLRDGACVQLVGGDYDAERVRVPDAVAQARRFVEVGAKRLHVVDLDAATGRGDNTSLVERIVREAGVPVQVGGGVRSVERARALVGLGADRVVVGTRAVEDRAFLEELVAALPGRVIVALDVRGTEVLVRGWQGGSGRDVLELARELDTLELAGLLVTAVHLEGKLEGIDAPLYRSLVPATRHPVLASGGVTTLDDLRALALLGCAGAVAGMALYTGRIDLREALEALST
jgi:phosphoribosylformimino-5-aminoimidazole carboxamide ribotide isomerase